MLAPVLGRRLDRRRARRARRLPGLHRGPDPAKRPASAGLVAARLSAGDAVVALDRLPLAPLGAAGARGGAALAVLVAGGLSHLRARARGDRRPRPPPAVTIAPTGQASDWTGTSRVLAEIDGAPPVRHGPARSSHGALRVGTPAARRGASTSTRGAAAPRRSRP